MSLSLGESKIAPTQGEIIQSEAPKTITKYHSSEINQSNTLLKHVILMTWAGIIAIVIGAILAAFGITTPAIVTTIAGAIVDVVGGILIKALSDSNESKERYFEELNMESERETLLRAIKEEKSKEFREKMIEKLVESYCERQSRAASK